MMRVEDDRAQDRALRRGEPHDIQRRDLGKRSDEHRGNDGEIFRYVVGDAECRQRAAGDEELFPDFDDLDELGRIRVEIDHVAGFLRGLSSGIHRHADIGLRERGRVVGAVAGHRDEMSASCSLRMSASFCSGCGLGKEVVNARFLGNRRGSERVVASDHHRANAHRAESLETIREAAFDDVLELDRAEHFFLRCHDEWRAAHLGDASERPSRQPPEVSAQR